MRAKKTSLGPQEFVTDRSKAVVLTWLSVACFGVRVSVMFHLMFVHYTFPEGEVARKKTSLGPQEFVTDRSKAVVLTWLSVACFGVRVSVMFHLMFVHYTFSSVLVAE